MKALQVTMTSFVVGIYSPLGLLFGVLQTCPGEQASLVHADAAQLTLQCSFGAYACEVAECASY
jgi:hypothetical protein